MTIRIWLAVAATALAATASPLGAEGATSVPANGLIAFVSATGDEFTDPGAGIGVVSADGSDRRLVTHTVPGVGQPAWSPDGRIALAFGSSIALVDADGSGLRTIPRTAGAVDRSPAWSPTGRLAFMRAELGGAETTLMLADGRGRHQRALLTGASLHGSPVWSQDGREVELLSSTGRRGSWEAVVDIATARHTIRRLPRVCADVAIPAPRGNQAVCVGIGAKGTPSQLWLIGPHHSDLIAEGRGAIGQPAWSRDGTRVAYAGKFGSVVVRDVASNRFVTFGADTGEANPVFPRRVGWSPDGRHIVVGAAMGAEWQIAILSTRSAAVRRLIGHTSDVDPRWSPDGRALAYLHLTAPGEGELRVRSLTGASRTVAQELYRPRSGWEYAWSPDSRALAFVSGTDDLGTLRADGSGSRYLGGRVESSPAWSPDGATIAITTDDFLTGGHRIVLFGSDGSAVAPTPPPGAAEGAVWSPDGASLFYLDESSGNSSSVASLWTFSTRQSQALSAQRLVLGGAFSPDGTRIYVSYRADGSDSTQGLIAGLGDAGEVSIHDAGLGAWSPDGASLALDLPGGVEIARAPAPGGSWQASIEIAGAHDPSWQPLP